MQPSEMAGAAVQRREDPALLTGDAEYADDRTYPGQLHLAITRSQYGHARIHDVDTSPAAAMDGVVAVYTREDLLESGLTGEMPTDQSDYAVDVERPLLVGETARFQGDALAAVVAEDRYLAHDAASAVEVEAERLDAVADVDGAGADGAPVVHETAPDNVAFEWEAGTPDETAAALADAATVVDLDLEINRVAAVPMEPRAMVARYQRSTGELDVELSCQNVLSEQDRLASVLGLPERKVSVRAPAVGGGFGVKSQSYAAHYLTAWCAMQLGRPVKWTATRSEAFATTNHSRRHSVTARAGLDRDGRLTALHVDSTPNVGAYPTEFGVAVPSAAFGTRLLGQYDIPNAHVEVSGVFTNTTPLAAYRGAGRPEAAYVVERLATACARELGEDPVEFRRRNFIAPDAFPYETPFGTAYDSGDYEKPLDRALDMVDYDAFRERQAAAREEGRYLGIGFSTYLEICGDAAGRVQGGQVRVTPAGDVIAMSSLAENGQGHATGFAQVIATELGVDYDDVEVVEGDTDRVPEGGGTGGSTAMSMGGSALKESAAKVREQAREIAAHELEAAPSDVEFEDGSFQIAGVPDRSLSIRDVARRAYSGDLPADLRGLEDTTFFSPDGATAPFGTHVCIVEVDPATGAIDFDRYVAVDDVGTQINPKLVEGQIVGGVVQSIGQAVFEQVVFDENGTNVTGSLQDYAVPRAADVPEIEWDSTVTPSPNNPLGVKGVGEAGTIAAMPAVVNAVVDALDPFGVDTIDMPLTPDRVYAAIHDG
jgi:carbon-monoxide dehydrogenase large subunit